MQGFNAPNANKASERVKFNHADLHVIVIFKICIPSNIAQHDVFRQTLTWWLIINIRVFISYIYILNVVGVSHWHNLYFTTSCLAIKEGEMLKNVQQMNPGRRRKSLPVSLSSAKQRA